MVDRSNESSATASMVSSVGLGGGEFGCDAEGCNNFRTRNLQEFNEHIADHKVISGAHPCMECGELVKYEELENHERPTKKQVISKLVFHPKCAEKFFKEKGFEVKSIK